LVVAAYSAGLRALIAALGRYRSPVSEDFLPLLETPCTGRDVPPPLPDAGVQERPFFFGLAKQNL
jgi:hypothetical protein